MKKVKIDEVVQKQSASKHQQKIKEVLCPQGHRATSLCSSIYCKQTAFCCSQSKCSCQKKHEQCPTRKLPYVLKRLQQKASIYTPVIEYNQKLIQQKIHYFQNYIIKLKKKKIELTQKFQLQFYSLYPSEKKVYLSMLNKRTDQIKSCDINSIQHQLPKQSQCSSNKQIQKLKLFWKQKENETDIVRFDQKLTKNLMVLSSKFDLFLKQVSNIIKNPSQEQILCQNFQNKIQSLKLLYRASDHNFQIKKFRDICENVSQTLTVVYTDKQKKFGGYTEFQWSKVNQYKKNNKVFLFSLDKKNVKLKNFIAENDKFNGPIFSQNDNMNLAGIKQMKLINKNNLQNSAMNYFNSIGENVLCDNNLKTKQWEVWKVNFKKEN